MPWLSPAVDHCRTAADVRQQCRHILAMRRINKAAIPESAQTPIECSPAAKIREAVCRYFQISLKALCSDCRSTCITERRVAIYLLKTHTGLSFQALGRVIGQTEAVGVNAYYKITSTLRLEPDHRVSIAIRDIERKLGFEQVAQ